VRDKPAQGPELVSLRERSLGLSLRDLDALRAVSENVVAASPAKRIQAEHVLSGFGRSEARVLGVGSAHFMLSNLHLAQGSLFDSEEERSSRRSCVLGWRARQDLFGYLDPIGQPVKINDAWFTVVGVLRPQSLAQESFQGVELESSDNTAFVPITAALRLFDRPQLASELDEIVLQVRPDASVERTSSMISRVMANLHGDQADYALVVPQQLLEQSQKTRRIFNVVMGGIAGISLLVGGIGIMNIMLASVLERTREIGTRRAVGATRRDIKSQFVTEAVLISLVGGILGIVLGFSIAWGVELFSDMSTVVTWTSIVLAFGFSVLVGLVFGTYPAVNAARLDPIEALRHE
jgi:putative ABC transport system permease protein